MDAKSNQVGPDPANTGRRMWVMSGVVLLALLALVLSNRPGGSFPLGGAAPAYAQQPPKVAYGTAHVQRRRIVDEIKRTGTETNKRLDRIIQLLESGRIQVTVVGLEPEKAGGNDGKAPKKK